MKEYFPRQIKKEVKEHLTIDSLIKRLRGMKKHCKSGQWHVGLFDKNGDGCEISSIGFNRPCGIVYFGITK